MNLRGNLLSRIFTIRDKKEFEETALEVFRYQAAENPVFKRYLNFLKKDIGSINSIDEIPLRQKKCLAPLILLNSRFRAAQLPELSQVCITFLIQVFIKVVLKSHSNYFTESLRTIVSLLFYLLTLKDQVLRLST